MVRLEGGRTIALKVNRIALVRGWRDTAASRLYFFTPYAVNVMFVYLWSARRGGAARARLVHFDGSHV